MKNFKKLWCKSFKNENENIVEVSPDGTITRRLSGFKLTWEPKKVYFDFEGVLVLKLEDFLKIFKKFDEILITEDFYLVDGVKIKPSQIDYYQAPEEYPTDILKSYQLPDISDTFFCVYKKYDHRQHLRAVNFKNNEVATTDCKQLTVKKVDCVFDEEIAVNFDYLESIKTGFVLNKKADKYYQIEVGEEKIDFKIDDIFYNQFPGYEDIIPEIETDPINIIIDDKVLKTMKKANDFKMDYMNIEYNQLSFKKFNDGDGATKIFINPKLDLRGLPDFAIDYKMILEAIKNGIDPKIFINSVTRPVVMIGQNKKYVLMPLRA